MDSNNEPASVPDSPAEIPVADGKLVSIFISPGHDYYGRQGEGRMQHGVSSPTEVECVAGKGLRGDRYFGHRPDYKGQVTFLEMEVVEDIRALFKLPKLPASVFRRNLIVRDMALRPLLGRKFRFQGVEFEGCQECKPCVWMDRVVAEGTQEYLKHAFRGGLRAKVLSDGWLRTDPPFRPAAIPA